MQSDLKLYFRLLPLSFLSLTMYRHSDGDVVVVSVHLQGKFMEYKNKRRKWTEMCKVWGSQTDAQKVSKSFGIDAV